MSLKRIASALENTPDLTIRQLILNKAQKENQIIYGARATNRQLPDYLQKETEDYDILTKKPKKSAQELAKDIKKFTNKEVEVTKASHKGTYKVKVDKRVVVDYTQLKRRYPTSQVLANKYRNLSSIKKSLQKAVKKKSNEFRREKDLDTLHRIKISEETFNFWKEESIWQKRKEEDQKRKERKDNNLLNKK